MILLSLIALALFGISIVLVLRARALPRIKAAERLDDIASYGYAGEGTTAIPALSRPETRPVTSLVTAIGRLFEERLGRAWLDTRRRDLLAAGLYRVTPAALTGYCALCALLIGTVGGLWAADQSPFVAIVVVAGCVGLGWITPVTLVNRRGRMRLDLIDRTLPELIDLLVVTVEAGVGLSASLQLASTRVKGPLGDELRLVLQQQRMGRSLSEALTEMLHRAETPGMRSFVRSVVQGESLGVSIGTIMRNLSVEMRKRRRMSVEEQAQKAPVKILFPLVFLIFPALAIVILVPAVFNLANTFGG